MPPKLIKIQVKTDTRPKLVFFFGKTEDLKSGEFGFPDTNLTRIEMIKAIDKKLAERARWGKRITPKK